MTEVIYKKHPKFINLFCGSNGEVYSLSRSKFINGNQDKDGYLQITISLKGKVYNKRKHRLIMEAFQGFSDLTVDHINNIKTDNKIENLRYMTRSENTSRSYRTGIQNNRVCNGERAGGAKLNEDQVKEIISMGRLKKEKILELSTIYSISYAAIFNITRNKSWKYLERSISNF